MSLASDLGAFAALSIGTFIFAGISVLFSAATLILNNNWFLLGSVPFALLAILCAYRVRQYGCL